jgi:hypothetical protein
VVALGENPGKLHRALAARAAGSVVVFIRHGQRAMVMKPQVKNGRSGGANPTGPSERCFAAPSSHFPDDRVPSLGLGFPARAESVLSG